MKRNGSAEWMGGIFDGKGTVSTESTVLDHAKYSFKTRFEAEAGTNPEELIAAAHAGCFSMALALQLEQDGMKPESINTTASVTLEKNADGFSIPAIHLSVVAKIPGADQARFEKSAQTAKVGCPVSKLMKATITMDATLEQ